MLQRSNKLIVKPNIEGAHKCLVSNTVDIYPKYKTNPKQVTCRQLLLPPRGQGSLMVKSMRPVISRLWVQAPAKPTCCTLEQGALP